MPLSTPLPAAAAFARAIVLAAALAAAPFVLVLADPVMAAPLAADAAPSAPGLAPLAWAAAVSFAGFLLLWPLSLRLKDASVADLWWGPGFAALCWAGWAASPAHATGAALAAPLLVTIWAARMGWTLGSRRVRHGAEDPRYAALRESHGAGWPLRSLFQVFVLQAALQCLVAAPAAALAAGLGAAGAGPLLWLGALLSLSGLALESAADRQLDRWKASGGRGLMRSGLRAWVRHPNYSGEALFWAGIGAVGLDAGLWWAPLSPILLGLLLAFVSGRPILEERLAERPGWDAYAARTPAFVPRLSRIRAALSGRGAAEARRDPADPAE